MSSPDVAQWDLTSNVSAYLDRHMIFPLLEYVDQHYDNVAAARLELLRPTHMVDYAIDIYKSLHNVSEVSQELKDQKEAVMQELERLSKLAGPLVDLVAKEKSTLEAAGNWTASHVTSNCGISRDTIESYKEYARFKFDCGDYEEARNMLSNYIALYANAPPVSSGDNDKDDDMLLGNKKDHGSANASNYGDAKMFYLTSIDKSMLQVLWGRLACEILVRDWKSASVAIEAVRSALERLLDDKTLVPLAGLHQRTWLLHWSLFVYWNDDKGGLERLVELFFSEKYRQAITTNAPHLLRYLTAAVLLCKRRLSKKGTNNMDARKLLKQLIYMMNDCEYSDPIVEFVNCLCVKFDFEVAQQTLLDCEHVLKADFFLCQQTDLFMEEARVFVFENYCRIHNKIDVKTIGEKLGMDQEAAERWIVDLIRNSDLDAKIDVEAGCVVMGVRVSSIYEQVLDRTRDLNVRSATLAQNLENTLNDARKEKAKKERLALEAE